MNKAPVLKKDLNQFKRLGVLKWVLIKYINIQTEINGNW